MSGSQSNRLSSEQSNRRELFHRMTDENGSITSLASVTPMTPTHSVHQFSEYQIETGSSLRRTPSYGTMVTATEANVLVIYTGGTIGMMRNEKNGKLFKIKKKKFFFVIYRNKFGFPT